VATIGNTVLTGATSGLGRLAALDLASKGARLGIVARDPVKAAACTRDRRDGCDGGVDVFIADLSSLVDVPASRARDRQPFERIDVLINNAGLHAFSQRVTGGARRDDGGELPRSVGAHRLVAGHSRLLGAGPRCERCFWRRPPRRWCRSNKDLTAIEAYTRRQSMRFYGRTKLMDIMFTQELGRR